MVVMVMSNCTNQENKMVIVVWSQNGEWMNHTQFTFVTFTKALTWETIITFLIIYFVNGDRDYIEVT